MIPSFSARASRATQLLREAGDLARHWYESDSFRIVQKGDGTPVTEADRDVESRLRGWLREAFPEDGILGEEFGEEGGESGGRWIIDPIDGTKSFIHHVPLYSTLLAYENAAGEIEYGGIYAPSAGMLIEAERGRGAWSGSERLHVSERARLEGAHILSTWIEDWSPAQFARVLEARAIPRTWGDAFGYAMVASGRAEAVIDFTVQPYDLAPMPVIIGEAGGVFGALDGSAGIYAGTGIASNGLCHEEVRAIFATP